MLEKEGQSLEMGVLTITTHALLFQVCAHMCYYLS